MQLAFAKARQLAHDAVAIVGIAAGAQGLLVTLLTLFGVHISAATVAQEIGAAGVAVVLLSKAIDSANNAFGGTPVPVSGVLVGAAPATGIMSAAIADEVRVQISGALPSAIAAQLAPAVPPAPAPGVAPAADPLGAAAPLAFPIG
jgi:hypothetical protein